MDFRSISTFVQVAELGSFTKARELLGCSQPTISFHIKQLEKELGSPLLERIGHTVHLTEADRRALPYAQSICRTAQKMAEETPEAPEVQGEVRLAMSDFLCTALIAQTFSDFRRRYPWLSTVVRTAGTHEMYQLLYHNEVDIVCTMDSHIYSTAYIVAKEAKIPAHFVCSARHPLAQRKKIAIRELLTEPFLLTEKGMSYRRLMDEKLAEQKLEIHPVLEMESADLICHLVPQNGGLFFLPDFVTERAVGGTGGDDAPAHGAGL